jgi:excisionase family DNA binding protein
VKSWENKPLDRTSVYQPATTSQDAPPKFEGRGCYEEKTGHAQMAHDLSDLRFLTVGEVADMMRVSSMTVYRMVHAGEIPAVRFGRSFRIPESAVVAAIQPELHRPVADAG